MFWNSKNLSSASDLIDALLQQNKGKNLNGAISIVAKSGRKVTDSARIFLYENRVYAVSVDSYEVPIGKRIASDGHVPASELTEAYRNANSETSPEVLHYLMTRHALSEKTAAIYLKDHFIEMFGRIFSWENCEGQWHPDVRTSDFAVPSASIDEIKRAVIARHNFLLDFADLTRDLLKPDDLHKLTFALTDPSFNHRNNTVMSVIRLCDGKNTLQSISYKTGLTEHSVFKIIFGLWERNIVALQSGKRTVLYENVVPSPDKHGAETEGQDSSILGSDEKSLVDDDSSKSEILSVSDDSDKDHDVIHEEVQSEEDAQQEQAAGDSELKTVGDEEYTVEDTVEEVNAPIILVETTEPSTLEQKPVTLPTGEEAAPWSEPQAEAPEPTLASVYHTFMNEEQPDPTEVKVGQVRDKEAMPLEDTQPDAPQSSLVDASTSDGVNSPEVENKPVEEPSGDSSTPTAENVAESEFDEDEEIDEELLSLLSAEPQKTKAQQVQEKIDSIRFALLGVSQRREELQSKLSLLESEHSEAQKLVETIVQQVDSVNLDIEALEQEQQQLSEDLEKAFDSFTFRTDEE